MPPSPSEPSSQTPAGRSIDRPHLLPSYTIQEVILTVLVTVVIGTSLWKYGKTFAGIDFYQFRIVSSAMIDGEDVTRYAEGAVRHHLGEKYYEKFRTNPDWRVRLAAESRRDLETLSTPFLYTVFRVFTGSDYSTDYYRYQGFSTLVFLAAVVWLALRFGHSWLGAAVLLTLFCFAWEPTLSEVRVANVNRILLAILCVCVVLRSPRNSPWVRRFAACLLGMSLLFKPVLIGSVILLVCLKFIAARWREGLIDALWIGGGGVFAVVASTAYFQSWGVWLMWAGEFSAMDDAIISPQLGNYSPLLAAVERTGLPPGVMALCCTLTVLLAFTLAWYLILRRLRPAGVAEARFYHLEVGALLGGVPLFLLGSKLVWLHYLMLLIPLFIVLLRPSGGSWGGVLPRTVLSGCAVILLGLETWRAWLGPGTVAGFQIATILGLVCIVVATIIDQFDPGPPTEARTSP